MIKGIGIDIIEIERIRKAFKNKKFEKRIFTKNEIEYFKSINYNIYTIAGTFASKEAIVKTFGTGLRGFKWVDVEIVRDGFGKPMVTLYGGAKEIANEKGISNIELSISHCREYAVAQAIGV
ncbi:holo-ACP synthase [Maledivibacter halophilus]|uniref:Holo-[acyl-carrier-protein] synthase n=1 Tax=Maledivibacter halophilus TaxID=36842 RepID=A0A1T5JH06_9FIRM|nr:holo-ACP synthase [Maledivibacter halophilus]SKC50468.1 holo-[acyl-carrier-protein] synthase [Maledivibacter halophilus]